PWEVLFSRVCFVQIFIRDPLRLDEPFVQGLGDPWIFLIQFTANDNHMHDRKYSCPLIILALDSSVVFEQSAHLAPWCERCRRARSNESIDLPGLKHLGKRFAGG